MAATNFDFPKWQQKFEKLVHKDLLARASRDRLLKAGCSSRGLTAGLLLSCDFKGAPGHEIVRELRFHTLQRANRALRIARRLELDRKEVIELLGSETPGGLEDGLKAAIALLREQAKKSRRAMSLRYLSPARALMMLIVYIETRTGSPHYRDVSLLLEAAYDAFGTESKRSIGEEAIRKAVERLKRRDASLVDQEFLLSEVMGLISTLAK